MHAHWEAFGCRAGRPRKDLRVFSRRIRSLQMVAEANTRPGGCSETASSRRSRPKGCANVTSEAIR
jgi:hypothetical protein